MPTTIPDSNAGALTFLVADDHLLVREGLKMALLQFGPAINVLEAGNVSDALALCGGHPRIDLVLLDLQMPGAVGLSALEQLTAALPRARIVVLSALYEASVIRGAMRKGAAGFIPKSSGKDVLLSALRFVLGGGVYIPPEAIADDLAIAPTVGTVTPIDAPVNDAALSKLTARQVEVLRGLLQGKSNKQICRDMNIALGTVKTHLQAIFTALEVGTRAEAIALADKRGLRALLEPHPDGSAEP